MTEEKKISESTFDEVRPHDSAELHRHSYRSVRGFSSLVVTQFLGAVNDNILKGILIYMVIDGSWTGRLGAGGQGIVSLCLSLPFILLSGIAGEYADRYSKRDVAVVMKIAEIPIGLVAMYGFWIGNLWLTMIALVALSSQSAIFGPAKYGMIPELVSSRGISRANGIINMLTNVAVIVGTLAAGSISDAYSPLPSNPAAPNLLLPGFAILLVAVAGFVSGHAIRPVLVPIGAAGLSLFFFLLGTVPPTIPDVPAGWSPALRIVLSSHSLLILGAGFSSGFYIIPLQSLLQHRSPAAERGRFLGTASAISFMFLTLAAIIYPVIRPAFGQHPEKIFLVCCGLILAGMIMFMLRLRSTGMTLAPVVSE